MSCDICGSSTTSFSGGVVCSRCRTVVVEDGVTGWDVYDRRILE